MGLFDIFKGKQTTAKPQVKTLNQIQSEQEAYKKQSENDRLFFEKVSTAEEKYKTDKNPEPAILEIESAYKTYSISFFAPHYVNLLVKLYVETGQNNKAWEFLNSLLLNPNAKESIIRGEQAWLLKKEKRHKDAVEMFLYQHLANAKEGFFSDSALMKDIGVSVRALKWTSDDQEEIANIVKRQVDSKKYDSGIVHKEYAEFLKGKV